jgi:hypothetical protein
MANFCSADNQSLFPGMTVYVLVSHHTGAWMVEERKVASVERNKILYDKRDEQGYIGCNLRMVFVDMQAAHDEAARFNSEF